MDNWIGDDLPDTWVITTLADTCEIIMGQSPPSTTYNDVGIGLPFFQGKADFGAMYPTATKWCSEPNKIAEAEDVLISVRAPVGPTNLAHERSAIGRGLVAIRPELNMPSRYFLYQLRHLETELASKATGTTFAAISKSIVEAQKIVLAPLNEQYRIVDEIEAQFSRLDSWLAMMEKLREQLPRLRASILKAAVEGRLVEQDPNDESAEILLKRILDERRAMWETEYLAELEAKRKPVPTSDAWRAQYEDIRSPDVNELAELPKNWIWATAEQIGEIRLGRQRSPDNRSRDFPTKYIRAANITERGLDVSDILEMEFSPKEREIYRLHKGDLVISEASGSPDQVGKSALWNNEINDCCFQNTVIRFRAPHFNSEYLLLVLKHFYQTGVMSRASSGVGINHLSASRFAKLAFPIAPETQQSKIVDEVKRRLSTVDSVDRLIEDNIARAAHMRQAILKKAFEGELVDQRTNDEPARELLERIHIERQRRLEEKSIKPKQRRERVITQSQPGTKSLYSTLYEAGGSLTVHDLFQSAGFTHENIDDFYMELRKEIEQLQRVGWRRAINYEVYLEIIA